MNSKDYWRKREEEALKHYITDEEEYDKQIKQIYEDMLEASQKEIDTFYRRYAKGQNITISEAKKRVSSLDIKAYEKKAARYVKDKVFTKQANAEMRLYNATMRINRLEMLKANIGLELLKGHSKLERFMEKILKGRTEEELKRQAGILGNTIQNNAKNVNSIVNASFHNATFSNRIWQYHDLMKADLSKLLQTGLIQGKNPNVLAKELEKYYVGEEYLKNGKKGAVYNTQRLMRTELARVQTDAQKKSFEQNGFEKYMFIVNANCCDVCEGINGKIFNVKDLMPGENAPPMHPHCRCAIAPYEDSEEYEAWIDYLDNGGTTKEWNKLKKANKSSKIQIKEGKKLSLSKLEDFEQWLSDYYKLNEDLIITKENFPNLNTYTGGAYEGINAVLRYEKGSKQYLRYEKSYKTGIEGYRKVSDEISKEISKFKNNTDLQVSRSVGEVSYITGKTSSLEDMIASIGKTYTEKGFTSTTICSDTTLPFGGFKETKTKLEIYVPKETRGAYIHKVSDSPAEFEYLIDKNTTFKIVDAGERTIYVRNYKGEIKTEQERFMKLEVVIDD